MGTKNLQTNKRKSEKDALKAVVLLQQAEAMIKAIRAGKRLEYVDYIQKVDTLNEKKIWAITAVAFIASIPAAFHYDFIPVGTEGFMVMGIPVAGMIASYNIQYGDTLSAFMAPFKMYKARRKQDIEEKVHQLYELERQQKELDILLSLEPLLIEINQSLKTSHRRISYEPQWGIFSMKTTVVQEPSLVSKPEVKSLPRWDNIYVLATTGNIKEEASSPSAIPVVEFTQELLSKKNPSIAESIAILKHTEESLKKALSKTGHNEETRYATDPSDHEYIKEENRLTVRAQPALDVINRAIDPTEGKVVYTAGTRFPVFNISRPDTKKRLGKWENMEKVIAGSLNEGRITALKAMEMPQLTGTTGKP